MAKNEAVDATLQHNSKARADVIRESLDRLYQLDSEIDDIIAAEIKELRDEKSEIKTRLRDDFNMPAKLVMARYAAYRMERKAIASADDKTLDAIRELYSIAPVGSQMDLVDAIERAGGNTPAQTAAAASDTPEGAYAAGYAAGKAGKNLDTAPIGISRFRSLKTKFEEGWEAGQLENMPAGPKGNGTEARSAH